MSGPSFEDRMKAIASAERTKADVARQKEQEDEAKRNHLINSANNFLASLHQIIAPKIDVLKSVLASSELQVTHTVQGGGNDSIIQVYSIDWHPHHIRASSSKFEPINFAFSIGQGGSAYFIVIGSMVRQRFQQGGWKVGVLNPSKGVDADVESLLEEVVRKCLSFK